MKLPWLRLPRVFVPTHQTDGLPGDWGAIDVFAKPGTLVFPPESGTLHRAHMIPWSKTKRVGGGTIYLHGKSGAWYFLTHFEYDTLRTRPKIQRWHRLGKIAAVPNEWWAPHIHEGKHVGPFDPGT